MISSILLGLAHLQVGNGYITSSNDKVNIVFDFSNREFASEKQESEQDPYFEQFSEVQSSTLVYKDLLTEAFEQMRCSNRIDISENYGYTPFVKGWGIFESQTNTFDVNKDNKLDDLLRMTDELPG
jgi:hypothetical protein